MGMEDILIMKHHNRWAYNQRCNKNDPTTKHCRKQNNLQKHCRKIPKVLLSLVILLAGMPLNSYAQQLPTSSAATFDTSEQPPSVVDSAQDHSQGGSVYQAGAVHIQETDNQLFIGWPGATAAAAEAIALLPVVRYQGYELPMQLFPVILDNESIAAAGTSSPVAHTNFLEIQSLTTTPWQGEVEAAAPLAPTAIDWESYADLSSPIETVALPTAPLFLLRQGTFHGQSMAVWAFSPLYQDDNGIQLVTNFAAQLHHMKSWGKDAEKERTIANMAFTRNKFDDSLRQATIPAGLEPKNIDAAKQAIKLVVTDPGIQAVTGAQLVEAGFDIRIINPTLLQLKYLGTEIAIELDGLSGGRLIASSVLRFYVPTIADRWNSTAIYWLTVGTTPGVRMAQRLVTPGDATVRTSALEQGVWRDSKFYDSRYAGADQDHWFHTKLISSQNNVSALETITVDVSTHLPRIDGTASYTIALTTNVRGQHTLRLSAGTSTQDITWDSFENGLFVQDTQQLYTSTVKSTSLALALFDVVATNIQSDPTVLLDQIFWQQPVALSLQQTGAAFTGLPGTWRYSWSGLPTTYHFYDVTTPTNPIVLAGATASAFQDGPEAHDYVLTAPNTIHTPVAMRHDPVTFSNGGADAIYIAPARFFDTLEPLLALRRDQGYKVTSIDVQTIYDAWSYGHVSPAAIRNFLRYAHANWSPTPYSTVLVGDGTWDPHNYEEKDNENIIPPYLAHVDPWLGETACENCYVQLNGDDPLTGDNKTLNDSSATSFFSTDMWIGRLPVKSTNELANMIAKITSYETWEGVGQWQNNVVFVADNYLSSVADDGMAVIDLAGYFAKHSDNIASLAPPAVQNERIYYDPYPQVSDPRGNEPWRITDAAQAFRTVLQKLSAGAGVVVYNGHSHQWQWAVTDEAADANPDYLLGLYDTDALTNQDRYFINLSMTCLTSQFHKPALSGTVLDERMLLNPNGGAIAVWGPAGLSVAYGHDFLQRGFFEALWSAPSGTAHIGELIEAGYTKLLTEDSCCQDTAKTFLLLGDPLTKARAYPDKIEGIYIPLVHTP